MSPDAASRSGSLGQSIAELAITLPVLLLIFAGAADLGRMFYAQVAIENAAKEGALYGATNPVCATDASSLCDDPQNVEWRVLNEASNIADVSVPLVECINPATSTSVALTQCESGYTYRVVAQHSFRLLTPILSGIFGNGLTIRSESRATVLNQAFDPTPGVGVVKEACFGTDCTPVVTPTTDADLNLIYIEGMTGDLLTYRITVTNIGGRMLTGLTISDRLDGATFTLPIGTAGCPAFPTSLSVAASWQCTYSITAPGTGGPPDKLLANITTVDATQIDPTPGEAIVRLIAGPPRLTVAKHVNVYKNGQQNDGVFGNASTIDLYRNGHIQAPFVWYRLIVTNTGGQDATGVTISDSQSALTVTADCPAAPTTLAIGASWACKYQQTFTTSAPDQTNTLSADATAIDPAGPRTTTATVNVLDCLAPDQVVPHLIGLTRAQGQAAWTAAGFTGAFNAWTGGPPSTQIARQSVRAFSCVAATTSITVSQ
jgi:uncharacterized repeat protein (TIGR01451 family)